jgi:hypothetical protein
MGRPFAREPWGSPCPWSFREYPETLFHKALARALNRRATGCDLLGNLFIAEPFIGFQQNTGAQHLSGCGLARTEET